MTLGSIAAKLSINRAKGKEGSKGASFPKALPPPNLLLVVVTAVAFGFFFVAVVDPKGD